jgi:hypothetical protein
MHVQHDTLAWPTIDDFRRVRSLVAEAHDELERLSWAFNPILNGNDEDERSFEELGHLAAFVSSVSGDVESMSRQLAQLARARDVVVPTS